MKYSFEDKVAIITGSSRGIGKAVALALAKNGTKVVLNGRDELKLEKASKEFAEYGYEHIALAGDISDPEFCQQLVDATFDKYGKLDILINNAGLSAEGKLEDTSPDVFRKSFEVNVLGVIYPTRAAIPYLRETQGSIIITGSIAGFLGLPEYSAYSATKMALTALSQSLRIEVADSNIHVGLFYVGFAENDEQKTYINKDGEVEVMPIRSNFKRMPLEKVASIFLNGIAKRKRLHVLSGLGKFTWWISRLIPGIMEKIMTRRYLKDKSKD
jgi:short-subunit dehydrogenase